MHIRLRFLGFFLFLSSINSIAFAKFDLSCLSHTKVVGHAQVQVVPLASNCSVYITPTERNDMVYRSFLFTDDGILQVFNSYGNGAEARQTGARVYAFFPRTRKVQFSVKNETLRLKTSREGLDFEFDTRATPHVVAISTAEFKEEAQILPHNNGGLELTNARFVYLDSGFGRGAAPHDNAASYSTFHDGIGKQCVVRNGEVYRYENGTAYLKSDSAIRTLLAKSCPTLQNF